MTTAPHPVSERSWESLHIDEKLALRQASARLEDKFAGLYGRETIERFLASSFGQFADRAKVTRILPLLAERSAAQRLQALARVEGLHDDGKPVVLFLRTHNVGRSQMALGFFQAMPGDKAVAWSGAPSQASKSTRQPSQPWPNAASASRMNSPNPGPMKPSGQPTWLSRWAVGTRARSSPANATRTGMWTTRQGKASKMSGPFGTNSSAASAGCWRH